MNTSRGLTIVIPAYNEELGIQATLNLLLPIAKSRKWAIIVINDGSSDKTKSIVEKISSVTLLNHVYNKGYGAALKTGIRYAKTNHIAMYDADGQHNPEDLVTMWDNIENYDMLVGERGKDSHQDWMRKPGKWILSKVANFLTGRKIPDLNSGLRIIKRDVIINKLHLFSDAFSFSTTSTVALMNMGHFVGYYPIKVNKRIGSSTVKQLKHGSNTVLLIIRLIILYSPLKVFMPASIFLFILGVVYEIVFGWLRMPPGTIKLIPTAFFILLTSLLIFFFGLVVDQISEMRKYQNVRDDKE